MNRGEPMLRLCRVAAIVTAMVGCAVLLSGCGGYQINGIVVRGDFGEATFTESGAISRDTREPIAGAEIRLHRDAGRPNQQLVASGRSDESGRIHLRVDQFGAGWMTEQWLIQVIRRGYETVERVVTLPASSRRQDLIVTMREGISQSPGGSRADPLADYERFRR